MVTEVDVQFFSHLNGLTLNNEWGEMIRMLDKTLVNGVELPAITAASIDVDGSVHLTFFANHKALILQVVELSGFAPSVLNQRYRVKGVPSANQLILKPKNSIIETAIITTGGAILPPLGYEIVFRDTGDVKRVYRAKNATEKHPYIRVDETLSDGTNTYNSTYAKYAMVGLLEHMEHIDDYLNPDVHQIPVKSGELDKNWKVTGTGSTVKRGWSRWYWSRKSETLGYTNDDSAPPAGNRGFTLVGDSDAFYFLVSMVSSTNGLKGKVLNGAGIYIDPDDNTLTPPWFLMSTVADMAANFNFSFFYSGSTYNGILPLSYSEQHSYFYIPKKTLDGLTKAQTLARPILFNYASGASTIYNKGANSFMNVPFGDSDGYLRGSLPHILYSCSAISVNETTPVLSNTSMYVTEAAFTVNLGGGYSFYLGEFE